MCAAWYPFGMPRPEQSVSNKEERPAERALFQGLFDDAAVFPPGLAPLGAPAAAVTAAVGGLLAIRVLALALRAAGPTAS